MYQSGEMTRTFGAFAERGFFRSVGAHGVAAAFGGYLRTLELDRTAMERHFRAVHDDIAGGGFAARFQAERDQAYPVVELIRQAILSGRDPMSCAEDLVRDAITRGSPRCASARAPVEPPDDGAAAPLAGGNGHLGAPGEPARPASVGPGREAARGGSGQTAPEAETPRPIAAGNRRRVT